MPSITHRKSEIVIFFQLKPNFTLLILFVIFCFPGICQQRNADRIITIKKDTLTVKISDVGLHEIKYQKPDENTIHTLAKTSILKVLYGNGETEEFRNFGQLSNEAFPKNPDSKYYKMVVATPFQKSILHWSDQKLLSEQKRYENISQANLFLGITSIVAGSVLLIHGITTIFDYNHSAGFMIAGAFTGPLGIPLLAFRNRAKKRSKSIVMEIERRRFQQLPTLIYR